MALLLRALPPLARRRVGRRDLAAALRPLLLHARAARLRVRGAARARAAARELALAVAAEAAWEVFENTEYVINRYRETTAALGYNGDTVVNSLGDIIACTAGVLLARKLGLLKTLLVFALTEIVLLFWIRDSLLLNILLLVYPSEAVKAWQAGH